MACCERCGGTGIIITCCDDMCVGGNHCIHGDGEEVCPDCYGEGGWDEDDRDDGIIDGIAEGYGQCPNCGGSLSNWGAVSRGDGDLFDEIGCDVCEEVIREIHASYCTCEDCRR